MEDRNQIKDRIDKETARRLKLRLEEIEEQIRQQVTDELKEQQTRDEKEKERPQIKKKRNILSAFL